MRTKTKRSIARAVFAVTLLLMVGIIGGLENGYCTFKEAVIGLIPGMIILFVAGAKGDMYRL